MTFTATHRDRKTGDEVHAEPESGNWVLITSPTGSEWYMPDDQFERMFEPIPETGALIR